MEERDPFPPFFMYMGNMGRSLHKSWSLLRCKAKPVHLGEFHTVGDEMTFYWGRACRSFVCCLLVFLHKVLRVREVNRFLKVILEAPEAKFLPGGKPGKSHTRPSPWLPWLGCARQWFRVFEGTVYIILPFKGKCGLCFSMCISCLKMFVPQATPKVGQVHSHQSQGANRTDTLSS